MTATQRSRSDRPAKTARPDGVAANIDVSNGPFLSCRDVDVAYGPVQVLFGVNMDIYPNEIVALLGTNGAGKSTIFKAITGLQNAKRGTIILDGEDITGYAANETAETGCVMMPGGKAVFPTLTTAENLRLAAWMKRKEPERAREAEERVLDMFPRLKERYNTMAGNMSGGEQQMLAMSQALMADPKLLLIDELSLGLAPTIVGQLIDVVHQIHETGLTIVVVEQSINVALTLAQRAIFMEKGEVRFTGPTQELLDRPDILRSVFIAGASAGGDDEAGDDEDDGPGDIATAMAGFEDSPERSAPGPEAPIILECRQVVKRFGGITAVDHVDIELRQGEILGLIGQNGAGKTTLFDCVSGFLPTNGGRIFFKGVDITDWQPHERAVAGIGRSFQEAKLYPSLTTKETLMIARERHLMSRDIVAAAFRMPVTFESERDTEEKAEFLIDLMGLSAFREKLTGELSTGSRRIIELACILASDPDVVVLDEPSGGVAQKETEALGPLLQRVQAFTGTSILVIEHDMPLLSSICDRMYALELGAVITDGTPAEVLDHPRVIESYLGTNEAAINRSGAQGENTGTDARDVDGNLDDPAQPAPTRPTPRRRRTAPLAVPVTPSKPPTRPLRRGAGEAARNDEPDMATARPRARRSRQLQAKPSDDTP